MTNCPKCNGTNFTLTSVYFGEKFMYRVLECKDCNKAALDKEGLSETDVEMAIREHGVDKISEVKEAVLENDGSISVVTKGSGNRYRRRRRVRFLKR